MRIKLIIRSNAVVFQLLIEHSETSLSSRFVGSAGQVSSFLVQLECPTHNACWIDCLPKFLKCLQRATSSAIRTILYVCIHLVICQKAPLAPTYNGSRPIFSYESATSRILSATQTVTNSSKLAGILNAQHSSTCSLPFLTSPSLHTNEAHDQSLTYCKVK
jgi:hypothetical protein